LKEGNAKSAQPFWVKVLLTALNPHIGRLGLGTLRTYQCFRTL